MVLEEMGGAAVSDQDMGVELAAGLRSGCIRRRIRFCHAEAMKSGYEIRV